MNTTSIFSLKKVGLFVKKVLRLFLIPFAIILFLIGWTVLTLLGEK
jgi:hypothetical protein